MVKETTLIALALMGVGQTGNVTKFGQVPDEEIRRLKDLGVMQGMPVTIQEKTISGPVVIAVDDAKIAIALHIAQEIFVLPKVVAKGE